MLGNIGGNRRRVWQRMRWLYSITDSKDMNLSKFQETEEDRGDWYAAVPGAAKSWTWLSDWTTTITQSIFAFNRKQFSSFCDLREKSLLIGDRFVLLACMFSYFSCVWLFVTPWTIACQAPLSMELSRQEYWNGLPCPPPGDLPDAGFEPESPMSPALQGDTLPLSHQGRPDKITLNSCKPPKDYLLKYHIQVSPVPTAPEMVNHILSLI